MKHSTIDEDDGDYAFVIRESGDLTTALRVAEKKKKKMVCSSNLN